MTTVTSVHNELVKHIRGLSHRRYREETGQVLLEGVRLVEEAFMAGATIRAVLYEPDILNHLRSRQLISELEGKGVACHVATRAVVQACADTQTPQGLVASCEVPHCPPLAAIAGLSRRCSDLLPLVVALDGLQDPGNVGTIMRTACGAGALAVAMGEGTVDAFSPKVLRASMGAQFRMPLRVEPLAGALASLKGMGYTVVFAAGEAEVSYTSVDMRGPMVVVVGNEGAGVSDAVRAACDFGVSIPMARGVESLNVGIAAALMIYEVLRQQKGQAVTL